MLSHVSLGTSDAARAAAFYDPVLATLGIRKLHERDGSLDYGTSIMPGRCDPTSSTSDQIPLPM